MTLKVNPVTLLASPLGEEGHEVAKGWTVVRMIMTLDVDVTAERRHYNTHRPLKGSLCIASLRWPPIGGQDRDGASYRYSAPYTLSRFAGLPLKGKRGIWREKQASHILHVPFRCSPPLWWLAPPPFPLFEGALWMLSHGAMSLQESIERFILSPGWGKVRRSRIRGSRAAANHQNGYFAI